MLLAIPRRKPGILVATAAGITAGLRLHALHWCAPCLKAGFGRSEHCKYQLDMNAPPHLRMTACVYCLQHDWSGYWQVEDSPAEGASDAQPSADSAAQVADDKVSYALPYLLLNAEESMFHTYYILLALSVLLH